MATNVIILKLNILRTMYDSCLSNVFVIATVQKHAMAIKSIAFEKKKLLYTECPAINIVKIPIYTILVC